MDTPLRRDNETPVRKDGETPLRGVRPNIVQSIRAFRVQDLQDAATQLNQHFLYANLGNAQSKQDVLDMIAAQYTFPAQMLLFFSVARSPDIGQGDRANEAQQAVAEGEEVMPTDKLVDVSPLALRMSSPFNAGYWLAAA